MFQSTSMTNDESSACQITGEINQEMARGRPFQIDQCLLKRLFRNFEILKDTNEILLCQTSLTYNMFQSLSLYFQVIFGVTKAQ